MKKIKKKRQRNHHMSNFTNILKLMYYFTVKNFFNNMHLGNKLEPNRN